jgi:hypothetical protein
MGAFIAFVVKISSFDEKMRNLAKPYALQNINSLQF